MQVVVVRGDAFAVGAGSMVAIVRHPHILRGPSRRSDDAPGPCPERRGAPASGPSPGRLGQARSPAAEARMTSRREVSAPDSAVADGRDEAMAEELWRRASSSGMTRRRFLELMAAGGFAAVLVACIDLEGGMDEEPDEPAHWFKDTEPFIEHADTSLEARLELMDEVITPTQLFFVRNNSPASLDVDAGGWRLSIEGDAIDSPLELSYEEIRRLPSRSFVSYLECAGNQRAMFERLAGWLTTGSQWTTGGISN
ncbi:MAG: molybdopterin-dependent oxidoreductase, partial [Chloroflexi bacterium]|nr:molybdopterin-dependent oxidoreductase [Chloroflexota bacterium]